MSLTLNKTTTITTIRVQLVHVKTLMRTLTPNVSRCPFLDLKQFVSEKIIGTWRRLNSVLSGGHQLSSICFCSDIFLFTHSPFRRTAHTRLYQKKKKKTWTNMLLTWCQITNWITSATTRIAQNWHNHCVRWELSERAYCDASWRGHTNTFDKHHTVSYWMWYRICLCSDGAQLTAN